MSETSIAPHDRPCRLPPTALPPLPANLSPKRRSFIAPLRNVWANGTRLRYHFLETPPAWLGDREANLQAVRGAFLEWKELGIGLEFQEVEEAADAEIRICFRNDGSWSYIGREALLIKNSREPTMNFGWDLTSKYGKATALHEIGHALGIEHEHQNPRAGIVWNTEAVLEHFSQPPNSWSPAETWRNILQPVDPDGVHGSSWDQDSIMHYRFEKGLILVPAEFKDHPLIPKLELSPTDKSEIRRLYPPMRTPPERELRPFISEPLDLTSEGGSDAPSLKPGDQVDFKIAPRSSRTYTISTFGETDLVMVLFEMVNGVPHYIAGNDDAGTDDNARIVRRLNRDSEYRLRIRLAFAGGDSHGSVMLW